jgi:hypothetical protein
MPRQRRRWGLCYTPRAPIISAAFLNGLNYEFSGVLDQLESFFCNAADPDQTMYVRMQTWQMLSDGADGNDLRGCEMQKVLWLYLAPENMEHKLE